MPPPAATPAGELAPGTSVAGRYALERPLGQGSVKRVYRARDERLDRDVAISLVATHGLDEDRLARAREEALAVARLGEHPHLVTVLDAGEEERWLYVVSQLMRGGSLEDALTRANGAPLRFPDVLRVTDHVCRALAYVHERGVVHRDVKPANVWLTEDGTAKLGDFGVATTIRSRGSPGDDVVRGSAGYLAPEQAADGTPDPRSDLYAVGVMLYELVTGGLPFTGDDAASVVWQHLHTPPVAPSAQRSEVPAALEELILALLAKRPDERPQSAAAVLERLAAIADGASGSGMVVGASSRDRVAADTFVGRERELSAFRAAFERAQSGDGRVVLLSGEPGIGKTRILHEMAAHARRHEAEVLWGRCYEGAGAPPFWPWVQVVRALVSARDGAALRAVLGRGAAAVAALVPEIRERLPELPEPPSLASEQARFRLFDSLTAALKRAAGDRVLVVLLDDLQDADLPSLVMLGFIARELRESRVLIVGTHRDAALAADHPLAGMLVQLAREPTSERIALAGLAEAEVGRFIGWLTAAEPPRALVQAVHERTDGNPFFVTEVVRLLVAEGPLERAPDTLRMIPSTVRMVIESRVSRLPVQARQALAVAAVAGRDFERETVEGATTLGGDALLEALDGAVAARLLTETSPRRYRFMHALVRETLYGTLRARERSRLHLAIGEVLERRLDPPLAELAHHFGEAGPAQAARAFTFARRAGDAAMRLLAWEEAARLYERALVLDVPAAEPERARVLLALGKARFRTGEHQASCVAYEQAFAAARAAGDVEIMCEAAVGFEWIYAPGMADSPVLSMCEQALTVLGDSRAAWRARVQAVLAVHLWFVDFARSCRLAREAAELADASGDAATLCAVHKLSGLLLAGVDTPLALRLSMNDRMVAAAARLGDVERQADAIVVRLAVLIDMGDVERLYEEIRAYRERVTALDQPFHHLVAASVEFVTDLLQGRFADAERRAVESLATWGQGDAPAEASTLACLFTIRALRGEFEDAARELERMTARPEQSSVARNARPWLLAAAGRLQEARRELDALGEDHADRLPRDICWVNAISTLALTCAALKDEALAQKLYTLLEPHARRNVTSTPGALVGLGWGTRYLGLLATTLERFDDAERHFEEGLARNAEMGARPWLAWTQHDYAAMLLQRGRPEDRVRAARLLDEAAATARTLGMRPLVEQAEALATGLPRGAGTRRGAAARELDTRLPVEELIPLIVAGCRSTLAADSASVTLLDAPGAPAERSLERTASLLGAPMMVEGRAIGRLEVRRSDGSPFSDDDAADVEAMAAAAGTAIVTARRYRVVKDTAERLRSEVLLREPGVLPRGFPQIVGATAPMREMLSLMERAAVASIAVLIEGETGTGKEIVARGIHDASARRAGPFLPVTCAALPERLLESELFGHCRGAFAGATADRPGLFEAAAGGTLFLDEVGEMPAPVQAKLLRFLHDGELTRVGESMPRHVDVRVISATNRDLAAEVASGRFREDLYYRLAAFPIRLPPLRDRREDIPLLTERLLTSAARRNRKRVRGFTSAALLALSQFDWPGNVRELQNEIERAVVLIQEGDEIDVRHLSSRLRGAPPAAQPASLPAARRASLRQEGDYWTLEYGDTTGRLKDIRGLRHLVQLLRHPGQEFHVLELVGRTVSGFSEEGEVTVASDATGLPLLDATAKASYRRRLTELREELAQAERMHDVGVAARARDQIEVLTEHLAAAVGLGGRDRKTGSAAERARSTVTHRLRAAIDRIARQHAGLADHLAARVRTGFFCSYAPDPERPIDWVLGT